MPTQPSQSASSPKSPTLLGIGRSAFAKAVALLVCIWLLATFTRFPSSAENQVVAQAPGNPVKPETSTATDAIKDGSTAPTPLSPEQQQQTPKIKQYTDRVAVLIENRPLENLVPVMLHFHSVLGPEWPLIFYTTPTTSSTLLLSAPFARAVHEGRIQVRHLPPEVSFSSHRAVSLFLADRWIWEDLAPFHKILMFQADSIICSASGVRVDDFLNYDFIGAPIDRKYGQGYNGGLSIRSREMVLDLFTRHSYANDSSVPGAPANMKFEDQWLYTRMAELPLRADGTAGARLPREEEARRFAVETIWEERPLGFHQPVRWQKANMEKIMNYCPEVGMISGSAFF